MEAAKQHGHHLADKIFKCVFLNKNDGILIQISLNLFLRVVFRVYIGSGNGLVPKRWHAIIWANDVYYTSLGLDELIVLL